MAPLPEPLAQDSATSVKQPCSASLVGKHQLRQPKKHERGIRSPFTVVTGPRLIPGSDSPRKSGQ